MRSLRPLFDRHSPADALEREAERLKNRDWVEFLRVVHPTQSQIAEREYILSRIASDWQTLTTPILATHTLPVDWQHEKLLVACDHNTFASEIALLAPTIEKQIVARYGIRLKIHSRAVKRIDWEKPTAPTSAISINPTKKQPPPKHENAAVLEELIRRLSN
ncbi:MAG TPA: DciA family protein [Turneriella sp.]|nr:DciA family protein [Turneriella sp.]